ncbi:MAG TPA: hypothetical protein ENJ32_06405 [Crenotrichaceae bacterium]|nr:hypothetical protein [Crenotrichaceae bacterium]
MIKYKFISNLSFIQRSLSVMYNFYGVHNSVEFKKRISSQRSISNRGNYEFSLLVLSSTIEDFAWKPHLFREIAKRVRSVDEIGWIDNQRIGLILPYTSAEGATKVASLISNAIKDSVHPLQYSIYSHPSKTYIHSGTEENNRQIDLDGLISSDVENASKQEGMELENGDDFRHDEESDDFSRVLSTEESVKTRIPSDDYQIYSGISIPAWKRSMDIVGAAIGLILLSPVMILTAIAVKSSSNGPTFFTQDRIGIGMKPFKMYKFRSMVVNAPSQSSILLVQGDEAEEAGPFVLKKIASDPRVTGVGRFIRKWSLDELPQLFNVLVGDMSLVGPRPLVREEAEACTDWHESRFDVKPGLTCIWQVNGRSQVTAEDRSRMDLRYILNLSFVQDLKLLILTPIAVMKATGAH